MGRNGDHHSNRGLSSHVLIAPPTAHLALKTNSLQVPSAEELNALYWREIKEQRQALKELGDTASSITSIALCLLRQLCDLGHASEQNEVTIPRWLHQRMLGASITVGQNEDGSILVKLRESGRERLAVVQ